MHLVSCRHSTSGRTALRNLATRSMRRRTELMFQVVREKRMARMYQGSAENTRLIPGGAPAGRMQRAFRANRCRRLRSALTRRGAVIGEVDLEHAGIEFLGGVQIVARHRGVIALRV